MTIRVLVADDNTLFREGMASLLGRHGIDMAGLAKDAAEAVRKTLVLRPDVALLDMAMPLGGGVTATREILAERPGQAVGILTVSTQECDLFDAIRAGARGYLVKTEPLDRVLRALRIIAGGGAAISPHLARRLLAEFVRLSPARASIPSEVHLLSSREREVLTLVAEGATNREIGTHLRIAENTVKVHLRNIMDKLDLHNRQQAAAYAVWAGVSETCERLPASAARLAS